MEAGCCWGKTRKWNVRSQEVGTNVKEKRQEKVWFLSAKGQLFDLRTPEEKDHSQARSQSPVKCQSLCQYSCGNHRLVNCVIYYFITAGNFFFSTSAASFVYCCFGTDNRSRRVQQQLDSNNQTKGRTIDGRHSEHSALQTGATHLMSQGCFFFKPCNLIQTVQTCINCRECGIHNWRWSALTTQCLKKNQCRKLKYVPQWVI